MAGIGVQFILLLAFQALPVTPHAEVADCPKPCRCATHGAYSNILCDNAHLTQLPAGISNKTTDIAIGHNDFSTLRYKQFSGFPLLRVLYLQHNDFSALDMETVKVITSLKKLSAINISHNPLDCTCTDPMKAFLSWLNKKQAERLSAATAGLAIIDAYATTCTKPDKLKGRRLDRLKLKDIC